MNTVDKCESVQNSNAVDKSCKSKLLSICMMGRDDDYMLDFQYRITTTINHLARSINNLGQQGKVEILVTDWGSQVPMAQSLELSPEAAEVCRFIYVPTEVIRDTQDDKDYFYTTRASNVALRRASGEYVMLTSADQLIQEHSLGQLLRLLGGEISLQIELERTYFMIARFQVPWQFLERIPDLEAWDRYMLLASQRNPLEPVNFQFFGGGAGALMMHKSIWHKIRGVDENYAGHGAVDVELAFQVVQEYSFFFMSNLGIFLYHMGHTNTGARQNIMKNGNALCYTTSMQINSDDWGLGSYTFEKQAVKKNHIFDSTYLSFEDNEKQKFLCLNVRLSDILFQLRSKIIYSNVKKIIFSFSKRKWVVDDCDLDALLLISWYSCNYYPHKYLEFTAGMNPVAGVVAVACPHIEMYVIDRWEGENPSYSPRYLKYLRRDTLFSGYVRYINGDVTTALDRLKASFIGEFKLDLIYIKGDALGNDAIYYIQRFLEHLTPGGALVFSNNSEDNIDFIWNKLISDYPKLTFFRSKGHRTGLILKKSMPLTEQEKKVADNICFDNMGINKLTIKIFGYLEYVAKIIISRFLKMVLPWSL